MITREERLAADGCLDPLLFYAPRDAWGIFSNFSNHTVVFRHPFTDEVVIYPTTEHRFQAMKAQDAYHHDLVIEDSEGNPLSAGEAKTVGRAIPLRPDWGQDKYSVCWFVMVECLIAKTTQHYAMREALDRSKGRHIYEDSAVDDIWGWRHRNDHRGKNLLGEALMHTRELLHIG